jgi:hypothetical protein
MTPMEDYWVVWCPVIGVGNTVDPKIALTGSAAAERWAESREEKTGAKVSSGTSVRVGRIGRKTRWYGIDIDGTGDYWVS